MEIKYNILFSDHPVTHHVSYSPEAKETPVYLPELDSLSYGDTLYGSEYTVGRSSAAVTVTITFPSAERECQDLPRPLAPVPPAAAGGGAELPQEGRGSHQEGRLVSSHVAVLILSYYDH